MLRLHQTLRPILSFTMRLFVCDWTLGMRKRSPHKSYCYTRGIHELLSDISLIIVWYSSGIPAKGLPLYSSSGSISLFSRFVYLFYGLWYCYHPRMRIGNNFIRVCLSVCLSICLCVCPSVYVSVNLSVCLLGL